MQINKVVKTEGDVCPNVLLSHLGSAHLTFKCTWEFHRMVSAWLTSQNRFLFYFISVLLPIYLARINNGIFMITTFQWFTKKLICIWHIANVLLVQKALTSVTHFYIILILYFIFSDVYHCHFLGHDCKPHFQMSPTALILRHRG